MEERWPPAPGELWQAEVAWPSNLFDPGLLEGELIVILGGISRTDRTTGVTWWRGWVMTRVGRRQQLSAAPGDLRPLGDPCKTPPDKV